MTADIKRLDTAKRHLTESITVLKRLQMLGKKDMWDIRMGC
jgi:hypothetical protein